MARELGMKEDYTGNQSPLQTVALEKKKY